MKKMLAHQTMEPTPVRDLCPDCSPKLAAIVKRLLRKQPEDRYNSIDDLIKSVFAPQGSGAVAWALRVADCESGDNPRAVNSAGGWYGLFQFSMSTFRSTPYGGGNVFDALTNARAAAWLYSRDGGSPWGCK